MCWLFTLHGDAASHSPSAPRRLKERRLSEEPRLRTSMTLIEKSEPKRARPTTAIADLSFTKTVTLSKKEEPFIQSYTCLLP